MNSSDCTESAESSDDELIQLLRGKAFRLLARREYSCHELRQRFKGLASPELCEQVLRELSEQGAQSDSRFAEMICRSRFNGGKGPVKLKHELNQHQIDVLLVERFMAEYEDRWAELAREVRIRKFGCEPPADFKQWARQARFLQQRGFKSEHIGQFSDC